MFVAVVVLVVMGTILDVASPQSRGRLRPAVTSGISRPPIEDKINSRISCLNLARPQLATVVDDEKKMMEQLFKKKEEVVRLNLLLRGLVLLEKRFFNFLTF